MTREDKFRVRALERKIARGDLDAMFEYARLYQGEFIAEVTEEIAAKMVDCYENCIECGNLTAALNLGAMYYEGNIIPRDFGKAFEYYTLATASEDANTQIRAWCNLGYCYYYGRDIPVDDAKAFNCYLRGAVMNDANCLYKLGDMYRYGRFVAQDLDAAVFLYRWAWQKVYKRDSAYPDVCSRMGECALYGIGMERDAVKALEFLTDAEIYTCRKIKSRDPFAPTLLPRIREMLDAARRACREEFP